MNDYRNNAEMWNCIGLGKFAGTDRKAARTSFEKAVDLAPSVPVYHVNLAQVLLYLGKINSAQGQIEDALRLDPNEKNALYLSVLAFGKEGKAKDAMAQVEKLIQRHPSFGPAYMLKGKLVVEGLAGATVNLESERNVKLITEALEIFNRGKALTTDATLRAEIEREIENETEFLDFFKRSRSGTTSPASDDPSVTPLKILSKKKAEYSEEARRAGVEGTISLAVLFGANGQIERILILKGLGHGLDKNAIKAASAIRFVPQKVNGVPVPTVRKVTFKFDIY